MAVPRPAPAIPIVQPPARPWNIASASEQGAVLRGVAPSGTVALSLDGDAVPIAEDGAFIIAFDRDAPSSETLTATFADGHSDSRTIAIAPGRWDIQNIDASLTGGVSSAEFQRRRAPELARINAARAQANAVDGWRQAFIWPTDGRITGVFGSQRIYRGTPASYHSGVDMAGAAGTVFRAPADGVVILAADEPFTLEGRLLMIDHGHGLNSAFLHCSKLYVTEGQQVRQGQPLGRDRLDRPRHRPAPPLEHEARRRPNRPAKARPPGPISSLPYRQAPFARLTRQGDLGCPTLAEPICLMDSMETADVCALGEA